MLKMATQIETIVNTYKALSKIPAVTGGKLNNAGNRVTANWSVRSFDKGKNTKYSTNYTLDSSLNVVSQSEFGADISNELLSAVSPKETYKAIIREEKNGKDAKKQYLEVWKKSALAHCIDLTALELHGDVYADSEFGNLDWNQDETQIVYVAERKKAKFEPYIKRKLEAKPKCGECGSGDPAPKQGEEFIYRQDWGEQLVGKYSSVIVVCTLADESLTVVDKLPAGWCPGQMRFSPDGSGVVGVAWPTEPRRLGLIFCTNRPSFIFSLTLADGALTKLSEEGKAVRSPRISPRGELVWLQRAADGPHHACHQIMYRKTDATEAVALVDIVETEKKITNGEAFYGAYNQALPKNCFTQDGRLIFCTPQKNEVRSYAVDIESGSITDISIKTAPGSTTILDMQSDVILSTYTNLTTPGQVYVARLPAKGSEASIEWVRVSETTDPLPFASSHVQYLQLTHEGADDVNSFSAIYFAPKTEEGKKLPMIVWPHGGPHSNFVNAYSIEAAFFNLLGFACLQINYRGSSGAGDAFLRYLPGKAGDADVKDCKLATDVALQKFPINSRQLVLAGGSHGGFLVTHLSGQYPDVYKAVVTRNPAVDVATMFNYTDINDWCAVESGFEFTEKGPVSEEQLLLMRRCSPLVHVHKVRAATAMMLGSGDKRVPYYQGLEYVRRLKANGVDTRVYLYDDNHSLASQPAEMDNLINGAYWFLTHLD